MNSKEEWIYVKGYEGLYMVSSLGRLKSLDRETIDSRGQVRNIKGRILKPGTSSTGYQLVGLRKEGKAKTLMVHKLVAIAFLDHTPNGLIDVVDHINNDPKDNRVENLQITSNRINCSKDRRNKSSKYTGVHLHKKTRKWKAQIRISNELIVIGNYENEKDAGEAYINKLNQLTSNKR